MVILGRAGDGELRHEMDRRRGLVWCRAMKGEGKGKGGGVTQETDPQWNWTIVTICDCLRDQKAYIMSGGIDDLKMSVLRNRVLGSQKTEEL